MKQTFTHYYGDSNCPYMVNGVHLTSMRRAKLSVLAEGLGIEGAQPKNDLVKAMMEKLSSMDAPAEISELIKPKAKKKAKKKK